MSRRTLLFLIIAVTLAGALTVSERYFRSTKPIRTVTLEVVQGDLATLRPNGCEEYVSAGGVRSARILGTVLTNFGDNALIVKTDFGVRGGDQSWDSEQEWRVPVDGTIHDVSLLQASGGRATRPLQPITERLTGCSLFIESTRSYVPAVGGPPPGGPGARTGVSYPFSLRTHCGVTIMEFDGRWWKVSPSLSADPYNPPPGWDQNDERGTITLQAASRAEFRTSHGQVAHLVPTATPTANPFTCE